MVPNSPVDALGVQAPGVGQLVVDVVRARHDKSAGAHQAADTRYEMGFGTQWRDLLDDICEAFADRGFQFHKLTPGGHKIPIVNDCLVYVWRVPDQPDAIAKFASSPTRQAGFAAVPPPAMLWEASLVDDAEPVEAAVDGNEVERIVRSVDGTMPVVLVTVESTPRMLQSIQWAIAVLNDTGNVELHGVECIWEPELVDVSAASDVESFDSGTPVAPVVELQKQDRPGTDA
jgi:hypothetical protein